MSASKSLKSGSSSSSSSSTPSRSSSSVTSPTGENQSNLITNTGKSKSSSSSSSSRRTYQPLPPPPPTPHYSRDGSRTEARESSIPSNFALVSGSSSSSAIDAAMERESGAQIWLFEFPLGFDVEKWTNVQLKIPNTPIVDEEKQIMKFSVGDQDYILLESPSNGTNDVIPLFPPSDFSSDASLSVGPSFTRFFRIIRDYTSGLLFADEDSVLLKQPVPQMDMNIKRMFAPIGYCIEKEQAQIGTRRGIRFRETQYEEEESIQANGDRRRKKQKTEMNGQREEVMVMDQEGEKKEKKAKKQKKEKEGKESKKEKKKEKKKHSHDEKGKDFYLHIKL